MNKRWIACALAASMLLSMMPVYAAQEPDAPQTVTVQNEQTDTNQEAIPTGNCGAAENEDSVTWNFSNGTLTITGTGPMADYDLAGDVPWADYKESITSVVIGEDVTSIGDRAFMGCTKLQSVEIPDSVTRYGTNCFHKCKALKELYIGANVMDVGQIGVYLDTSMTTLTVDKGNTSYASIGNWLYKLNEDETAMLWQVPAGVIANEQTVKVPDTITWNGKTYTVTAIGDAGNDSYTLAGATNMTSVQFGDNVTEIGYNAFNGTKLTAINLSHISKLGTAAFSGCTALTSATLSGLTEIPDQLFKDCDKLTNVTIPNTVTSIGRYAFSGTAITSLEIPASVETIGYSAFGDCTKLEKVTGGAGLTRLGDENAVPPKNAVFQGCSSLTTVNLIGTESLSIPGDTFGLSSAPDPISDFSLENGSFSGEIFHESNNLETLTLGEGVTEIPENFCNGQTALTSATLTGAETIGASAFQGCTSLKDVAFGDSLNTIGNYAFSGCTSYGGTLILPDSVTEIERFAFDSTALEKVKLNAGLTKLGEGAFNACKQMTVLDMSEVTAASETDFWPSGEKHESIMISRSDGELAIVYVGTEAAATNWGSRGTLATTSVAITDGGVIDISDDPDETTGLYTPRKAGYKFDGWYEGTVDNEDEQKVGSQVTGGNKRFHANWAESQVSASVDKVEIKFGSTTYGTTPEPQTITVTGGTVQTATSTNEKAFTAAVNDDNTQITVTPTSGLAAGSYSGDVVITFEGGSTLTVPVTLTVEKVIPTISLTADKSTLTGAGTVTLTVEDLPDNSQNLVSISSEPSVLITQNDDGKYKVSLPNKNQDYTFTLTYTGDANHEEASATCKVTVTEKTEGGSTTPPSQPSNPGTPSTPSTPSNPASPESEMTTKVTLQNGRTVTIASPDDVIEIPQSSCFQVVFTNENDLDGFALTAGNGKAIATDTVAAWNPETKTGTYTLYGLGAPGSAHDTTGIYVNGVKLFTMKVVPRPLTSDTTVDFTMSVGQTYQFWVKPDDPDANYTFNTANGDMLQTSIVKGAYPDAQGRYLCRLTVTGRGDTVGVYCNIDGNTYKLFTVNCQ